MARSDADPGQGGADLRDRVVDGGPGCAGGVGDLGHRVDRQTVTQKDEMRGQTTDGMGEVMAQGDCLVPTAFGGIPQCVIAYLSG